MELLCFLIDLYKWIFKWIFKLNLKDLNWNETPLIVFAEVPVFVRSGAVLTKKMRRRRSSVAMAGDPYTLVVYGEKAQGGDRF